MTDPRPREYHDGVLYVGDAARRLRHRRPDIPPLPREMDRVRSMRKTSNRVDDNRVSQTVAISFDTDPSVSVSLKMTPRETAGGGVIADGTMCVFVDHHHVSNPVCVREGIRFYDVAEGLDDEFLSRKLRRDAALWLKENARMEAISGIEDLPPVVRNDLDEL